MFSGRQLARLRGSRMVTQEELADRMTRLGAPTIANTVSKWERGVQEPRATSLVAMCRVLRCRPESLVVLDDVEVVE